MASRLRLLDWMLSSGPRDIGIAQGDIPSACGAVNAAVERLRYEQAFGDEGPPGSYAEVAISVPRHNPFITCPRGIASIIAVDVCKRPVPLQNAFFEYLEFGSGHKPKCDRWDGLVRGWHRPGAFSRNYSPTYGDLCGEPKQIMVVPENVEDCVPNPVTNAVPRVLIQGLRNGTPVTTVENGRAVNGEYVTVTQPCAVTKNLFDAPALTGVQKDVTLGNIQLWQRDPWWEWAEIISVMEPTETTGWYRRYYLNGLPPGCCRFNRCCRPSLAAAPQAPYPAPTPQDFLQVTALARLDIVPVMSPTDYTLIQSLEALKMETLAGYFYRMQDAPSQQKAEAYHQKAVQILIGQSYVEEGKNNIAANVAMFGRADWRRVSLGMQ